MKEISLFLFLSLVCFSCNQEANSIDDFIANEVTVDTILTRSSRPTTVADLVGLKLENFTHNLSCTWDPVININIDSFPIFPEINSNNNQTLKIRLSAQNYSVSNISCTNTEKLKYAISNFETTGDRFSILNFRMNVLVRYVYTDYNVDYYVSETMLIIGKLYYRSEMPGTVEIHRMSRIVSDKPWTVAPDPELGKTIHLESMQYKEQGKTSSIWNTSKQKFHNMINLNDFIVFPEYGETEGGAVLELEDAGNWSVFDFRCGINKFKNPQVLAQTITRIGNSTYHYNVDVTVLLNYYHVRDKIRYLVGEKVRIVGTCLLARNAEGSFDVNVTRTERRYKVDQVFN